MASMIGKLIKDARLKKGLSQRDLSKLLGLDSPQFISNIERNIASPPPHFYFVLNKVLGIKEKDFVEGLVDRYRQKCIKEIRYSRRDKKLR